MHNELLLVGSIPMETAEQVFRVFGSELGEWLAYLPDGEVGDRRYWIDGIAYRVLNGHPEIEVLKRPAPDEDGVEQWRPRGTHDEFQFRVKPGVSKVRFGDPGWRFGYTRDAVNSYAIFRLLKKDGVIPEHVRFQVCLPLTYSAVTSFFPDPEDHARIVPGTNEALRAEVKKMVELIPAKELAIQWDLAVENRYLEPKLREGMDVARREARRLLEPASEICSVIPGDVALGYHICFGTLNGWPSRQPPSLAGSVLMANASVEASNRRVDFIHIPTVGSSSDDFFAPLQSLKTAGARIYIGAIHHMHDSRGMRHQLAVVRKYLDEFGIAAPCGFGRVPERPGRLLTDDGSKPPDHIEIILKDHKVAIDTLRNMTAQ
jgi:hypothetical protein